MEKLYLKLDKRLVLKARKLLIPGRKHTAQLSGLPRGLERLHLVLKLFQSIDLEEVDFTDNRYRIIYKDRIIYISSRQYEVAGMVYDRGDSMEVQIPLLRIPAYHVTLSGELHYRYRDGEIEALGFYEVPDLSGAFRLSREGERIRFRVDSMETASLRRLLQLITMSREAKEWLEKRVLAEGYRLEYLEGEGRFDFRKGEFHPDLEKFRGAMALRKVRIRFHDELLPIRARSARVVLKEGNLYFLLKEPLYGERSLAGSRAALLHLNDPEHLTLLLRLRYGGRVDWQVLRILQVYGLGIKVGQHSGRAEAKVDLDIPLGKGPVKIRGIADFSPGALQYGKELLQIGGGELAFSSRELEFRRLEVDEPWSRAVIDGRLDLKRRRGRLTAKIRKLRLGKGDPFLLLKDRKVPMDLRWSEKEWELGMPTFKSELQWREKEGFRLKIGDLSRWRPWLRGIFALPEGGSLTLETRRGERIGMRGTLRWSDSFLYTGEGPVTTIPFAAKIQGKSLELTALGGALLYRSSDGTLTIRKLNIDARRLLETLRKIGTESKKSGATAMTVRGEKSIIRYGSHVLLTDRYRLKMLGKNLDFQGSLGRDKVRLARRGNLLTIEARQIGDRMLHALIHFNGLQEGRYTIQVRGDIAKESYKGEILIRGGVLKDFKAFNDMMALFNTVPALVAFSNPGFSARGFELVRGKILFTLKGDLLSLDAIELLGKSSTVVGKGTVNLASKVLKIELAVQTAREVGSTIGQIPLVGYILFGEDKSLAVGVKIDGTLEKPKVHTNPVGDALLYPLKLLKRTLTAPAHLVNPKPTAPKVPMPKDSSTEPKSSRESNASRHERMF